MTTYVFTLSDKTPAVEIDVKETVISQGAGQDLYDRAKKELGYTGTFGEFLATFKGEKGERGTDGLAGAKGDKGDTGERGIQGERGADGLPGARGERGEQGPIGPAGPKGADGLPGTKGERGADGVKGDTGERGIQGERGADGLPGARGERGEQGPIGPAGPKGADGLPGTKGERGADGAKGDKGDTGERGPIGPQGLQGERGRDGVGIAQKLTLSGNTLTLSDGGGSVTLPRQEDTPSQQYEIHGTGMPNGKVEAPVGTTYVDTNATNGALKWIKRTGSNNQGWEVLTGDTGWRTLNIHSKLGASYLKVRRKNDTVMYQFGGLSWGWFGIVRRGGPGYSMQPSDKERNVFILGLRGIPEGFRSEFSLIGGIYNDKGTPYGTWYVGGPGDAFMLRFQFADPVPTDRDIGDIRVSPIMYLTNEPWPTSLP